MLIFCLCQAKHVSLTNLSLVWFHVLHFFFFFFLERREGSSLFLFLIKNMWKSFHFLFKHRYCASSLFEQYMRIQIVLRQKDTKYLASKSASYE
jgi:hypothetical protein